jgi:hypothetical protein
VSVQNTVKYMLENKTVITDSIWATVLPALAARIIAKEADTPKGLALLVAKARAVAPGVQVPLPASAAVESDDSDNEDPTGVDEAVSADAEQEPSEDDEEDDSVLESLFRDEDAGKAAIDRTGEQ